MTITKNGFEQDEIFILLDATVTLCNELKADVDALKATSEGVFAKMDSDTGIGDTNYDSVYGQSGSDSNALPADVTAADLSL